MSGEHTARTWWIGLEYKNDDANPMSSVDPNKWFWLDGTPVDTSIRYAKSNSSWLKLLDSLK